MNEKRPTEVDEPVGSTALFGGQISKRASGKRSSGKFPLVMPK